MHSSLIKGWKAGGRNFDCERSVFFFKELSDLLLFAFFAFVFMASVSGGIFMVCLFLLFIIHTILLLFTRFCITCA